MTREPHTVHPRGSGLQVPPSVVNYEHPNNRTDQEIAVEPRPQEEENPLDAQAADEFLALFLGNASEDHSAPSSLLGRAYESFCRQVERGEQIDPDEYCDRFPDFRSSLLRLIQVHNFFEEHGTLLEAPEEEDWPVLGNKFLGYEIQEELGRGAFARVFSAIEPAVGNRKVALKVAFQGVSEEIAILGPLHHPNVVPIYSVAKDQRTQLTAVCMPYRGRATLCNVLDRARSSVLPTKADVIDQAIQDKIPEDPLTENPPSRFPIDCSYVQGIRLIAIDLAKGLDFIHQKGIRHQDLKPSNVLLTSDGIPQLLDFNLSVDEKAVTNRLGGTLAYMSPEQLLATDPRRKESPPELDARSDLFSYGVILYELLTGQHPFGHISAKWTSEELRQLLETRHRQAVKPIEEIRPDIDRVFARIVHQCLAVNPDDRPASAAEIVERLERKRAPNRFWKWVVAAVLLPLTLGAGVAFSQFVLDPPEIEDSPETQTASVRKEQVLPPEVLYKQGRKAFEQSNPETGYLKAIKLFQKASDDVNGKDPRYVFALAKSLQAQRLWVAAADQYKALEELSKDAHPGRKPDPIWIACQGFCLHRESEKGGKTNIQNGLGGKKGPSPAILARTKYERAIKQGYRSSVVFQNLAWLLKNQGQQFVERATFFFDCAIEQSTADSNSPVPPYVAYYGKAQACWNLFEKYRFRGEKTPVRLYRREPKPPMLPPGTKDHKVHLLDLLKMSRVSIDTAINLARVSKQDCAELYLFKAQVYARLADVNNPGDCQKALKLIQEAYANGVPRKQLENPFSSLAAIRPKVEANQWAKCFANQPQPRPEQLEPVPRLFDPADDVDWLKKP